jgi:hypothetical protein
MKPNLIEYAEIIPSYGTRIYYQHIAATNKLCVEVMPLQEAVFDPDLHILFTVIRNANTGSRGQYFTEVTPRITTVRNFFSLLIVKGTIVKFRRSLDLDPH